LLPPVKPSTFEMFLKYLWGDKYLYRLPCSTGTQTTFCVISATFLQKSRCSYYGGKNNQLAWIVMQNEYVFKEYFVAQFCVYSILCTNEPGPKTPLATKLSRRLVSTMASSSFSPYHSLWYDDAPTKRLGVIPTPWMMMNALGLVQIHQAHE
jgi:hypothetical protein